MYISASSYSYGYSTQELQPRYQQQSSSFSDGMMQMRGMQGMSDGGGMQGMQGMPPPPPPPGGMQGSETTSTEDAVGTLMDYVSSLSGDEQSDTLQDLASLSQEGMGALLETLGEIQAGSTDMSQEEINAQIATAFDDILTEFGSMTESGETETESLVLDTYA